MTERNVVIVGAGKRVRDAALPALASARGLFRLRGIFARSARSLEAGGERHEVEPLAGVSAERMRGVDLVYLVVGKPNVPEVLRQLARFDLSGTDLLIETPVLLFRHFRHRSLLAPFRGKWAAEDCAELPWYGLLDAARASGSLGSLREVRFDRSAYAYHGIAMVKRVLGCPHVASARRRALGGGAAERELRMENGSRGLVVEPRDYGAGRFLVSGSAGSLSDFATREPGNLLIEAVHEGDRCAGFRAGDFRVLLDEGERSLMARDAPAASVTARMESLKRVGFLRLLRRIHAGTGAYSVADALDDMVVDYALERLGRYVASPLTRPSSPAAAALYSALGLLARR